MYVYVHMSQVGVYSLDSICLENCAFQDNLSLHLYYKYFTNISHEMFEMYFLKAIGDIVTFTLSSIIFACLAISPNGTVFKI